MKKLLRTKLMGGALVLVGAFLTNTAPVLAQDYGNAGNYNYPPAGQLDNLVSRIALYPDPLLAQIFAAAAFPDQIAAAAQGQGGPFDPSVEALMQYPSVLQMMASDLNWTQALGQAVMQDQGAVMDAIQNLRREAQQYGYLGNSPQMQVMDQAGYIDIEPVGGYMYAPIYDPYIVFAPPRPGFFVGGAIRFGGGFHWAGGYNSLNWRNHEVVVNRRVWTPPVRRGYEQPQRVAGQRRFENNRGNFTGGNPGWNRNYTAPAAQAPAQRNYTPNQARGEFNRPAEQRSFSPAPQQRSFSPAPQQRSFSPAPQQRSFSPAPQQRSFTPAPRQIEQPRSFSAPRQEQRGFTPQTRNEGAHSGRGGEGHGRGR